MGTPHTCYGTTNRPSRPAEPLLNTASCALVTYCSRSMGAE